MTEGGVTRRSLLGATAGALAAGALRPLGALAALADAGTPALREQWVGDLAAGEAKIALRGNADLIGVGWNGGTASLALRVPGHTGRLSPWVSAAACAPHAGPGLGAQNGHVGDPIWTGGVDRVELRADGPLRGVRIYLVDVSGGMGAHRRAVALAAQNRLPLATPVLQAGPGQPSIIARGAWAGRTAHPAVAPEYGAVKLAFVHHTDNPNGYGAAEVPGMLRAIYAFHRFVHGWNDIGYNFVVDLFGRIFEARAGGIDEPVIGAHAGGYNYVSTGVAVLGTFSAQAISAAARNALERLLAWKLALHGAPAEGFVRVRVNPAGAVYSRFPAGSLVSLPRVAGHRDADTTDCPGSVLYQQLPSLRPRIARLQGLPAQATLALQAAAAATSGAPPVAATLSGRLASLAGTPLAGAPVAIQERRLERKGEVVNERTLAQVSTNAVGEWALPVALAPRRAGTSLRALSLGGSRPAYPVTVSEPLQLHGVITPASAPPAAAGGSTPASEPAPGTAGGGSPSPVP
jgi:hypothetical protein